MTARDPLFVVGAGGVGAVSPTDARLDLAGLVAASTGGNGVRLGVFPGPGADALVTGTSGMSYSVAAFNAVVHRGASTGPYLIANDGAVTVSTTAAPGSGSRIDIIYVQTPDAEQGDSDSDPVIGVVQGASGGSPSAPALPTAAIEIARATVQAGATATNGSDVTISHASSIYTVARGAPIPVKSSASAGALTGYDGLVRRRLDTELDEVYYDGGWQAFGALTVLGQTTPYKVAFGTTVDTTSATGNITIDTGLTTLNVITVMNGDGTARENMSWSRVGSYSGGSVVIRSRDADTGTVLASVNVRYDWIAIGT
jgi:hypothetical protein